MIEPNDWIEAKYLPAEEGEYLCYCRVPKNKEHPEEMRYLSLEFAEGAFWVHGGAPKNFVLYWTHLSPPKGEMPPRGRKAKRIPIAPAAPEE